MKKYFWILILSGLFFVLFGAIIGGTFVYTKMDSEYVKVYETSNAGAFIFKKGKIYSLIEMRD
jgi:hypothetical protein